MVYLCAEFESGPFMCTDDSVCLCAVWFRGDAPYDAGGGILLGYGHQL